MKVNVKCKTSWSDVLNAARFTQNLAPLMKEPSDNFKEDMIVAEHSPLRLLQFEIIIKDIPFCNMGHLVRHVHAQPFVSTSRGDITGVDRSTRKQTDPVNMILYMNAQELINISKVRLCNRADKVTRLAWNMVIDELSKIEPILARYCVPSCLYRGFCPEMKCCGYTSTEGYQEDRKKYLTRTICNKGIKSITFNKELESIKYEKE
nr:MAG TPA: Thymidylate synthase thyX [Caudoviricetes sp.]